MGETWHLKNQAASTATCWLEIVRTCVLVPLCTENVLRFSARLDNGLPEVRFERLASKQAYQ